jgi:hypothetical protein
MSKRKYEDGKVIARLEVVVTDYDEDGGVYEVEVVDAAHELNYSGWIDAEDLENFILANDPSKKAERLKKQIAEKQEELRALEEALNSETK